MLQLPVICKALLYILQGLFTHLLFIVNANAAFLVGRLQLQSAASIFCKVILQHKYIRVINSHFTML